MITKNLQVYYFTNSYSKPKGILVLARNKKEATAYIKSINGFNQNFRTSNVEIIENFYINSIKILLRDNYYIVEDVTFGLYKSNNKKYLYDCKYYYAEYQEKTEKQLFKLFIDNLNVKELKYDFSK